MDWHGRFIKLPEDDTVVHRVVADGRLIPRRSPEVVDHRLWEHYSMRSGGWLYVLTQKKAGNITVSVVEQTVEVRACA